MVAFNFSPELAPLVESGKKNQTIRRTKRGKIGDRCQLYTGQRTKLCRKLRDDDPPLITVVHIVLRRDYFLVGNCMTCQSDPDEFARADGFKDYKEMIAWFTERYGAAPFAGFLHIWAPK